MIDRVSLYKVIDIDTRLFDKRKWHLEESKDNESILYNRYVQGVKLTYIDYKHKE
jgi:hypothetical protein